MLGAAKVMTFLAVTDRERARAYYGGALGLPLVEDDVYALVFDANGTMLRISPIESVTPAPYSVLGWEVEDIRTMIGRLGAKGIVPERFEGMPQDELGVCRFPGGTQVAWFKDADGNIWSLTQFVRQPVDAEVPDSLATHGIGGVGWLDLTVPNAEEVRDFYSAAVEWTYTERDGDYEMRATAAGRPVAGICHARGVNADLPPVWIPYFVVADLAAALARWKDRGGALLRDPVAPDAQFAFVRDTAGAVAAFWRAAAAPPAPRFKGAFPISGDIQAMPIKDLGPAIAFYTRVLGFHVESRTAERAVLKRGDAVVGIEKNGTDPEQVSCYFSVENLAALHVELTTAGVEPSNIGPSEHEGRAYTVFFAKEPYGVCFCFGEPA